MAFCNNYHILDPFPLWKFDHSPSPPSLEYVFFLVLKMGRGRGGKNVKMVVGGGGGGATNVNGGGRGGEE